MPTRFHKISHSANIYFFYKKCKHFTTWTKLWRDANVSSPTRSHSGWSTAHTPLLLEVHLHMLCQSECWNCEGVINKIDCGTPYWSGSNVLMICNIATTCAAETLGSVARQIMIWCEYIFLKLSLLFYGGPNRVRVCQGEKEDLLKTCLAVNGIYVNMIFFFFTHWRIWFVQWNATSILILEQILVCFNREWGVLLVIQR